LRILNSSPTFKGVKIGSKPPGNVLKLARLYNRRFQDFHLIVAGNYNETQRKPLLDFMKAIDDGKFSKKV
jgi:hypothetical protein